MTTKIKQYRISYSCLYNRFCEKEGKKNAVATTENQWPQTSD